MRLVAAALLISASAGVAHADCKDPHSNGEMKMCAEQDWKKAEAELNAAYGKAIAEARAIVPLDKDRRPDNENMPDSEAMLRDAQRAWVTFRDANCKYQYQIYYGGSHARSRLPALHGRHDQGARQGTAPTAGRRRIPELTPSPSWPGLTRPPRAARTNASTAPWVAGSRLLARITWRAFVICAVAAPRAHQANAETRTAERTELARPHARKLRARKPRRHDVCSKAAAARWRCCSQA